MHDPRFYRALLPALKVSRLKTVVHVQLEEAQTSLRWALKTPPQVIITCARFLVDQVRNALPEHLQRGQTIVAVPNAVDTDQFHPGDKDSAKQKVGAPRNIPLILLLANLAPHKGHETGIRATAILKEKGVNAWLWFAGIERGDSLKYTERLKTLCGELGVADRVRFLGQRNDVPELLRAADCVILPSTAEGLPLSILEAQATKVPVLAALPPAFQRSSSMEKLDFWCGQMILTVMFIISSVFLVIRHYIRKSLKLLIPTFSVSTAGKLTSIGCTESISPSQITDDDYSS